MFKSCKLCNDKLIINYMSVIPVNFLHKLLEATFDFFLKIKNIKVTPKLVPYHYLLINININIKALEKKIEPNTTSRIGRGYFINIILVDTNQLR